MMMLVGHGAMKMENSWRTEDDVLDFFDPLKNQNSYQSMKIQRFMGAPYVWGGASPSGTDCSGLVRTVYRKALGIDLSRNTDQLYELGYPVSEEEICLGDLVFFRVSRKSKVSHVGIYLDQGKFVHASLSDGVIISDLYDSWYMKNYLGARRI